MSAIRTPSAVLCALAALSVLAACQKRPEPASETESLNRGQQAFLANCALCHGDVGAGDGELAPMLQQSGIAVARLDNAGRLAQLGRGGVRRVIVLGGAHTGRSNLMPAWGERLGADLVGDIVAYVMTLPEKKASVPAATLQKYMEAPPGVAAEGRRVFVHYCSACHGPFGKGDGTFAETLRRQHNVRPRDLTDSLYIAQKTDPQLYETIALGGGHIGKSPFMPAWTVSLSPAQIKHLISYLRVISRTAPRP
jgi:mono/diheme cytochrome c family protein